MAADSTSELLGIMESVTKLSKSLDGANSQVSDLTKGLDKFGASLNVINRTLGTSYNAWLNWNRAIYDTSKALSLSLGETVKLEESIKKLSATTIYSQQQIAELYRMRAQSASMATMNEKEFGRVVESTSKLFADQGMQAMQTFKVLADQNKSFADALKNAGQGTKLGALTLGIQAYEKVGLQGALQFAQTIDYQRFGVTGNDQYAENLRRNQRLSKELSNLQRQVGTEIGPTWGYVQNMGATGIRFANMGLERGGMPAALWVGNMLKGSAAGGGEAGGGAGAGSLVGMPGGGIGGGGSASTINITANLVNIYKSAQKGGGAGSMTSVPGGGAGGYSGNFAPEDIDMSGQYTSKLVGALAVAASAHRAGKELANKVGTGEIKSQEEAKNYWMNYLGPRMAMSGAAGLSIDKGTGAFGATGQFMMMMRYAYEKQMGALDTDKQKAAKVALEGLTSAIQRSVNVIIEFNQRIIDIGMNIQRGTMLAREAQATGQAPEVVAAAIRSTLPYQKEQARASMEAFNKLVTEQMSMAKLIEGREISREEAEARVMATDSGKRAYETAIQSREAVSKGIAETNLFVGGIAKFRAELETFLLQLQNQYGISSSTTYGQARTSVYSQFGKFTDMIPRLSRYIQEAADVSNEQNIERLTEQLQKMGSIMGSAAQQIGQWIQKIKEMPAVLQKFSLSLDTMASISQSIGRPAEVRQNYLVGQMTVEALRLQWIQKGYNDLVKFTNNAQQSLPGLYQQLAAARSINSPHVTELADQISKAAQVIRAGPILQLQAQSEAMQSARNLGQLLGQRMGDTSLTGAGSLYFTGLEARRKYSEILPVSAGLQYSIRQEQLTADIALRENYRQRIDELLAMGYDKTNVHVQSFLRLYYEQHAKVYSDIMDLWGGFSGRLEAELDKFINGPQDVLDWMPRAAEIASMNIPLYGRFPSKVGSVGEALRTEPFLRTTEMAQMFKGQIPLMNAGVPWDNSMFHMLPQGNLLAARQPVSMQGYMEAFANEARAEAAKGNESFEGLKRLIEFHGGALPVKLATDNTSPNMNVPGTGLVPR